MPQFHISGALLPSLPFRLTTPLSPRPPAPPRYLDLFAQAPSETTTRIWDSLFSEGPKILFRVALGLLKMEEVALLHFDNSGGWARWDMVNRRVGKRGRMKGEEREREVRRW